MANPLTATWIVAVLATAGVILRPWRLPEAIWAVAGALLLVVSGLLPPGAALQGIAKGTDVYLFLLGMMLLAELARREGLFDWLAVHAATLAKGSGARLFALVYLVGTIVTIFLSNDATAVVLTPAVAAVVRTARAKHPLPYLLVCAFIANAASFVLPISNPANLVIYGSHMPPLLQWLPRFALPSLLSILATYAVLWLTQRRHIHQPIETEIAVPHLSLGGRVAGAAIALTAALLMTASALGWQLGWPTCAAGLAATAIVLLVRSTSPWGIVSNVSWGVLPLVAGLFVLVEALERTGLIAFIAADLQAAVGHAMIATGWASGTLIAVLCNFMNNLPAGLIAGTALQSAAAPPAISGAVLIGVDLGPNLSVTGSLATILWLSALRREGLQVSAASFLRLGVLVMPAALLPALGALLLLG
jgi:arsenical pump membrane protein